MHKIITNYTYNIHGSKKLGEHVFEMYAMLHKTIPHTQVYYQLSFSILASCITHLNFLELIALVTLGDSINYEVFSMKLSRFPCLWRFFNYLHSQLSLSNFW